MKPLFENINVAVNTSFKIATYKHTESCETCNWHIHPEYELVYVKNGNGTIHIGPNKKPYSNGALLFLGPNIPHTDFGNKKNKNNLEVVIQFRKEFIQEKISVFPEFNSIKKLINNSEKALIFNNEVKNIVSEYFEIFETLNPAQKLINLILILEKLSTTTNYKTVLPHLTYTRHNSIDIKRLELIFDYINNNYNEKIVLDVLAKKVGLTVNSLCRFFKKMTNKPILQFVGEFRIRKAKELLQIDPSASLSNIMYKCGFKDASYFTKQFKKHQNTTPSIYQKQLKLLSI